MNRIVRFVPQIIVAVITMVVAQAGPRSRVLDEDRALALLQQTLKHDGVYAHRISLDCITYGTEETTGAYFQFVLRENHNAKCGETPKRAPQSIATGFIVSPEKLNGWNGRKTTGNHITQRKSDNADSLLVTRLATVPILKKNRL
jgi:hypothetical protein